MKKTPRPVDAARSNRTLSAHARSPAACDAVGRRVIAAGPCKRGMSFSTSGIVALRLAKGSNRAACVFGGWEFAVCVA